MNSATYIGNFLEHIDCEKLVSHLKTIPGDVRTVNNPYSSKADLDEELQRAKLEMYNIWKNAGYLDINSVEWINYYGGTHFDYSIVEKFSELVNADPYNVWISSMCPGKCVPWHWDIIDKYQEHKHNPKVVRYSFFIDKPRIGKIFVLADEAFHMTEQGSVYKWTKWDEWHLGFNCGRDQKFLFHFIGFER
jgi:hypothetical protein